MSVAHVVFDLPLEGHFDYLVPEELRPQVVPGVRVKVSFGKKSMTGFVIALAKKASVPRLKPVKALRDEGPVFDERDLAFARRFGAYYGCSLGEALAVMVRHRQHPPLPARAISKLHTVLYHCPDGQYLPVIDRIARDREDYFIIVPDAFVAEALSLSPSQRSRVGLRSSMFEAFTRSGLIIVIDEDNISYKQEQSPMYETRQVVLMAQEVYGFEAAFIGTSPSVELMHLAQTKAVEYQLCSGRPLSKAVVIDLATYKFLDKGILSPPARNAIQDNINAKRQTLVILNRRGSYSVTRCTGCGHILKCPHCDSAIVYVRAKKRFTCRHCAFQAQSGMDCPQCGKPSWKSFGMGVEQLQKELSTLFPTARISSFEKDSKGFPAPFDVLIATQAVLRLRGRLNVQTVVCVDIDSELTRLDMRSSFKGWSLVMHARLLGQQVLVQTRNPGHHVLKALAGDDANAFYAEELRLRRELDFLPFFHWVAVVARSRKEKFAQTFITHVYNKLLKDKPGHMVITPAAPDAPAKVRDQYRFRVMVGGKLVEGVVRSVKDALAKLKRSSGVIVTLNVDP